MNVLLFGLIGTAITSDILDKNIIGKNIGIMLLGLLLRSVCGFFSAYGRDLNIKEKLFIAISWLPKATVQAALYSTIYDLAIINYQVKLFN